MRKLLAVIILFVIYCFAPNQNRRAEKVLFTKTVLHNFSSHSHKDIFKLTVVGDSLLCAMAYFQILDGNRQIYADTFMAHTLLGYYAEEFDSLKSPSDTIRMACDSFFAESHFKCPAIGGGDADTLFLNNDANYEDWKEIKSYKNAIGFYYFIRIEGCYAIAYSKKKKKAVIYEDIEI